MRQVYNNCVNDGVQYIEWIKWRNVTHALKSAVYGIVDSVLMSKCQCTCLVFVMLYTVRYALFDQVSKLSLFAV